MQETDLITEPIHWMNDEELRSIFTKVQDTMETLEVVGRNRAQKKVMAQAKIKTQRDQEEAARAKEELRAKQSKKTARKTAKAAAKKAAKEKAATKAKAGCSVILRSLTRVFAAIARAN